MPSHKSYRGIALATRAARAPWRSSYGALRKGWLCGCAGAPAQSRCIKVIALAEKRIGEELERGRAELLFGDR
jgi:hypothetical protein